MHFSSVPAPGELDRLGNCVARSELQATLAVPAAQVTEAVRAALGRLPISDISVEDPPLEEIMQEFLGGQSANGGVRSA
jgi:ABC-2 type transport system ATP-binding protein